MMLHFMSDKELSRLEILRDLGSGRLGKTVGRFEPRVLGRRERHSVGCGPSSKVRQYVARATATGRLLDKDSTADQIVDVAQRCVLRRLGEGRPLR